MSAKRSVGHGTLALAWQCDISCWPNHSESPSWLKHLSRLFSFNRGQNTSISFLSHVSQMRRYSVVDVVKGECYHEQWLSKETTFGRIERWVWPHVHFLFPGTQWTQLCPWDWPSQGSKLISWTSWVGSSASVCLEGYRADWPNLKPRTWAHASQKQWNCWSKSDMQNRRKLAPCTVSWS